LAKKKYYLCIKPSAFPDEKFCVIFYKKYGDHHGGSFGAESKEALLSRLRDVFDDWEGYDAMLSRNGDKVTPENLEVEITAPDVTRDDIFGILKRGC